MFRKDSRETLRVEDQAAHDAAVAAGWQDQAPSEDYLRLLDELKAAEAEAAELDAKSAAASEKLAKLQSQLAKEAK